MLPSLVVVSVTPCPSYRGMNNNTTTTRTTSLNTRTRRTTSLNTTINAATTSLNTTINAATTVKARTSVVVVAVTPCPSYRGIDNNTTTVNAMVRVPIVMETSITWRRRDVVVMTRGMTGVTTGVVKRRGRMIGEDVLKKRGRVVVRSKW
jgi:hypothetical protein